MPKTNYKALFKAGVIKTWSDLMLRIRKDIVDIYRAKIWWPPYRPTGEDVTLLTFYKAFNLEEEMDFGTFCVVWKENVDWGKADNVNLN